MKIEQFQLYKDDPTVTLTAYILDDSGIEVTVDRMIDYGKDRFAKCKLLDDTVYVKTDWEYKSGDKLHISIEIAKSRIFENKFDIRLY